MFELTPCLPDNHQDVKLNIVLLGHKLSLEDACIKKNTV